MLAKKKRSVKRKPPSSPEGCPPTRGKTLKVGASPSPSFAVGVGDSSGRADDPPLEVLPISVWSPTSRGAAPPPTMSDEVTGCFQGALIVLPCPAILGFLRGLVLQLRLLGLRFLLPQVGAQRQAFRLFFFLVYPGAEPGFLYCF